MGDLNYDSLQDSRTFTDNFVDTMIILFILSLINQQELPKIQVPALTIFGQTFMIKL